MKKKIFIIFFIIVVIVISLWFFVFKKEVKDEYTIEKSKIENIIQTVSEVGTVKADKEIKLSFLANGKLSVKNVEIGDKVKKGDLLAELDYKSLLIQKEEAESNLRVAKAGLSKVLSGARNQEIAVSNAQVVQAQESYYATLDNLEKVKETVNENISQAKKTLSDLTLKGTSNVTTYEQAINSAQISLDNTKATYQKSVDNNNSTVLTTIDSKLAVINTALDNVNQIIDNDNLKNTLSVKNSSYLDSTKTTYNNAVTFLRSANESLDTANNEKSEVRIDQSISLSLLAANKSFESLNYCFNALESSLISESLLDTYKATIDAQITLVSSGITAIQTAQHNLENARLAYKTNVSTAEDALNKVKVAFDDAIITAKNSLASVEVNGEQQITTAQNSVNTAKETWEVAKKQLIQLQAPARKEDIELNNAKIAQAKSSLALVVQRIEDSIIKSPIDGKIIKDEYDVGEQINMGMTVFSVLAENNFEIEVDISEADIAKVNQGNLVDITMDAFGDDIKFQGEVYFIEPAETVIQEVIYYKVKIKFVGQESYLANVKSGMTANVDITTNKKDNVLVVPSRAIIEKDESKKVVRVLVGEKVIEKEVEVGLRGDGGKIEILNGINEGENIITFIKINKKTEKKSD